MITKATAFLGMIINVLSKWDVRNRLHCLVLTDTYLYNFTKKFTKVVTPDAYEG